MKIKFLFAGIGLLAAIFLAGCATPLPPGAERGPNNTMAYTVSVESSTPGVRIDVNGQYVGETPLSLKIFGDPDGTFHDFGSEFYEIRALPSATNQFAQLRIFQTGHFLTPQDKIPSSIYFDMSQPTPRYEPRYSYPPPYYYYPPYYDPYFYGPRFYVAPRYHYRHHRGGIHYRRDFPVPGSPPVIRR